MTIPADATARDYLSPPRVAAAATTAAASTVVLRCAALLLMIPLALTSTTGWIRRLGGRNWNRLHRLLYITACAAVLHYYWKVSIKLPPTNPMLYAGIVAVLLGFRVWRYFARAAASKV